MPLYFSPADLANSIHSADVICFGDSWFIHPRANLTSELDNILALESILVIAEPGREAREGGVAEGEGPCDVPRRVEAQAVAARERPDEHGRAGEAKQEHGDTNRERPGPHLRQPEPDVERREEEHERIRIRRDDE